MFSPDQGRYHTVADAPANISLLTAMPFEHGLTSKGWEEMYKGDFHVTTPLQMLYGSNPVKYAGYQDGHCVWYFANGASWMMLYVQASGGKPSKAIFEGGEYHFLDFQALTDEMPKAIKAVHAQKLQDLQSASRGCVCDLLYRHCFCVRSGQVSSCPDGCSNEQDLCYVSMCPA